MNPGLAFGVLAGVPPGWRWIVAVLSLAALAVLARVALRVLPAHGWPGLLAVGLIFGGAVGNLIDRLRRGAVVDFIDVHWQGYHWPAFNVADSAITVGVRNPRPPPHGPPTSDLTGRGVEKQRPGPACNIRAKGKGFPPRQRPRARGGRGGLRPGSHAPGGTTSPQGPAGRRLDRWLALRVPTLSRSRLQELIEGGHVTVDGAAAGPRTAPGRRERDPRHAACARRDPPARADGLERRARGRRRARRRQAGGPRRPSRRGPHAGHPGGRASVARPGHRRGRRSPPARGGASAGRGTSGLLVVAKTQAAYDSLTEQLGARTVAALPRRRARPRRAGRGDRRCADRPPSARPDTHGGPAAGTRQARRDSLPRPGALPRLHLPGGEAGTGRTHQTVCTACARAPHLWRCDYRLRSSGALLAFPGIALHATALAFPHPITHEPPDFGARPRPASSGCCLSCATRADS